MQRTDAKEGRACWPYPRAGGKTATGGRVACEPRVLSAAARRQLAGGRPGQKARFNKININCRAAARPLNIQAPVRPPKKPFIAPVLRPSPAFCLGGPRSVVVPLSPPRGRRLPLRFTPTSRFGAYDVGKNSIRIKETEREKRFRRVSLYVCI